MDQCPLERIQDSYILVKKMIFKKVEITIYFSLFLKEKKIRKKTITPYLGKNLI